MVSRLLLLCLWSSSSFLDYKFFCVVLFLNFVGHFVFFGYVAYIMFNPYPVNVDNMVSS